jgi:hypothetical protein
VDGGLGVVGFPAHGTGGVAVVLLAGALQAMVAAGLGSVLTGRALARGRARVGDKGEPSRPAGAGDLVRLLGAHAGPAVGSPSGPACGRATSARRAGTGATQVSGVAGPPR